MTGMIHVTLCAVIFIEMHSMHLRPISALLNKPYNFSYQHVYLHCMFVMLKTNNKNQKINLCDNHLFNQFATLTLNYFIIKSCLIFYHKTKKVCPQMVWHYFNQTLWWSVIHIFHHLGISCVNNLMSGYKIGLSVCSS